MTLLYADGFDEYATAQLDVRGWNTVNGAAITAGAGRNGSGALVDAFNNHGVWRTIPGSPASVVAGIARKASRYDGVLFYLGDGFDVFGGPTMQLNIYLNSSGYLEVRQGGTWPGSTGSVIATGTTILNLGAWYYIELKATINNSTGSAIVHLNGVEEINVSGIDTQATANARVQQIGIVGGGSTDDFYLEDGTDASGTEPAAYNDFLGDVRYETLLPTGNGASSDLVGQDSDSTDNYLNVDDTTPDGDTTYNASATVGAKDLYDYGSISATTGTVLAVIITPYERKDDSGSRGMKAVARLADTTEEAGDEESIGQTYQYWPDIRCHKPGGGAWSISDVNDGQFGVEVSS